MFGIDPGMVARAMSSRPLWALGYPDRAMARCQETIALGRSQRQPVTFVFALIVAQGVHLYRGETAEAIALGDEIVALCREYEFPQEAEWARGFQASAMARAGAHRRGRRAAARQPRRAARAPLRADADDVPLAAGRRASAGRARRRRAGGRSTKGSRYAERTIERGFLAELHRVRGELLAAQGRRSGEAEASLRLALDVARQQQARSFELRAATSLARLLLKSGREPGARAVLEVVYRWFGEGRTTADLVAARTLLSEMR